MPLKREASILSNIDAEVITVDDILMWRERVLITRKSGRHAGGNIDQLPRLEWSQSLNSLSVLYLSANFLFFCTIKYYSAVQYSMVT